MVTSYLDELAVIVDRCTRELPSGDRLVPDERSTWRLMPLALVKYGAIPEVARFDGDDAIALSRGQSVVVETHRGEELGEVLEIIRETPKADRDPLLSPEGEQVIRPILRSASEDELATFQRQREDATAEYAVWETRIREWELDLQLLDLERTLNGSKLILYVLSDRGPDCTKLALQAAAAGLGVIEVQPVSAEGLVVANAGGGCGSCGCG